MSTDLDLHLAAPPPDDAQPGEGVRYLLEHAAFLTDQPARLNFRFRIRAMLREGRIGEAILAAMAYDARTLQLRGIEPPASVPPDARPGAQPVPDDSSRPHRLSLKAAASSGTPHPARPAPVNPLDQSWRRARPALAPPPAAS